MQTPLKLSTLLRYQLRHSGVTLSERAILLPCEASGTETAVARPRSVVIFESSEQRLARRSQSEGLDCYHNYKYNLIINIKHPSL